MIELFIGFIAAFCTTIAFLPQAIRIIKTKEVEHLSLYAFLLVLVGRGSWLTYGILRADIVIIIANLISLVITAFIVYKKVQSLHK